MLARQCGTGTTLGEPCWANASFDGFTAFRGKHVTVKPLRINTTKQTSSYGKYSQKQKKSAKESNCILHKQ